MVRLFRRACLAALLLLVQPASLALAEALPPARLFLLERDDSKSSWLFGTMHSSDPEILAIPTEVRVALARSDVAVGELDMGKEDMGAIFLATLLPEGETLADLLPPDLYRRTMDALEFLGLPEMFAQRFQPWMAAVMLSFEKEELERQRRGEEALDDRLQRSARERGKTIVGLETAAEQLSIFQNLPLEWQIEYLEMALDYPELVGGMAGEIKALYLAGDHAGMWDFYTAAMSGEFDTEFTRYFTQAAIVDRNHRMAERLAPILAAGGAFVAVGALHLPGPDGLLVLLAEQGYRISALP